MVAICVALDELFHRGVGTPHMYVRWSGLMEVEGTSRYIQNWEERGGLIF